MEASRGTTVASLVELLNWKRRYQKLIVGIRVDS
jgi:hypothetical protein